MEQFFMEMAKSMNLSDMETQMNQWMNNHESMFRMSSSWMNNMNGMGNFGNNMFSKMGNYGGCSGDGSNWKILPPSGPRSNSARPNFMNRYNNNFSGGMSSMKFGAMYDDGMCGNRFNSYSNNMNGNSFSNYSGMGQNSMYADGMHGNRFNSH